MNHLALGGLTATLLSVFGVSLPVQAADPPAMNTCWMLDSDGQTVDLM